MKIEKSYFHSEKAIFNYTILWYSTKSKLIANFFYENVKQVEGNHKNNCLVIDRLWGLIIKTKKAQISVFKQRFTFYIHHFVNIFSNLKRIFRNVKGDGPRPTKHTIIPIPNSRSDLCARWYAETNVEGGLRWDCWYSTLNSYYFFLFDRK